MSSSTFISDGGKLFPQVVAGGTFGLVVKRIILPETLSFRVLLSANLINSSWQARQQNGWPRDGIRWGCVDGMGSGRTLKTVKNHTKHEVKSIMIQVRNSSKNPHIICKNIQYFLSEICCRLGRPKEQDTDDWKTGRNGKIRRKKNEKKDEKKNRYHKMI